MYIILATGQRNAGATQPQQPTQAVPLQDIKYHYHHQPVHDLALTSKMLDTKFGVDQSKTVDFYKYHADPHTDTQTYTVLYY